MVGWLQRRERCQSLSAAPVDTNTCACKINNQQRESHIARILFVFTQCAYQARSYRKDRVVLYLIHASFVKHLYTLNLVHRKHPKMATIYDWYTDLMDNRSDPRVKDWPMMSSPMPTLTACLCYAYCSKILGPRLMANRKPFELRNVLVVYNLAQTLFSAWIFYEYLMSGWWGQYNFTCQLVDHSRSPMAMRMANTCWWYYFSKFTEFMDTLFFVLRKKNEHVSTLHVIHHGIMPMSVWFGLKFAPGGHSTFFALLNTFVHIVMYFYYMVAAMGPKYQKYIWWKKYLTAFQMVQFVLIFSHQLQVLFRPSCQYPRVFVYWIAMHGFLFLFLFSDFYKARYSHTKGKTMKNGLCMTVMDESSSVLNGKNGYKQEVDSEVPNSYASSGADAFVRRRPVS